jgi:hypothetical protein
MILQVFGNKSRVELGAIRIDPPGRSRSLDVTSYVSTDASYCRNWAIYRTD